MNYEEMFEFVRKILIDNNAIKPKKPNQVFRDRFEHTKRVYNWAIKIMDDFKVIDRDVTLTSVIFHDVGYAYGQKDHPINSDIIFKEYAKSHNFSVDFIDKVSKNILVHSNKELIFDKNSTPELIILMEADLLDEEGALGIAWDLMARGIDKPLSYYDAVHVLNEHSAHILNQNYMLTPKAKAYWEEKKQFVKEFIEQMEKDLFIK